MTTTLPAIPDQDDDGLGDIGEEELATPRLIINGPDAKFEDSLSGEQWDTLDVILLGLVRQRQLWPAVMQTDGKPMPPLCKSLDFKIGVPDVERFPWPESGFPVQSKDEPKPELSCEACPLKEWDSHPTRDVPWCNETHVLPLLMPVNGGAQPALLTFKSSGLSPSKKYMTSFKRTKTALYTVVTTMSLEPKRNGSVRYAVPILKKSRDTDQTNWPEYATMYRRLRSFVQTQRAFDASEGLDQQPPAAATATSEVAADPEEIPW